MKDIFMLLMLFQYVFFLWNLGYITGHGVRELTFIRFFKC